MKMQAEIRAMFCEAKEWQTAGSQQSLGRGRGPSPHRGEPAPAAIATAGSRPPELGDDAFPLLRLEVRSTLLPRPQENKCSSNPKSSSFSSLEMLGRGHGRIISSCLVYAVLVAQDRALRRQPQSIWGF